MAKKAKFRRGYQPPFLDHPLFLGIPLFFPKFSIPQGRVGFEATAQRLPTNSKPHKLKQFQTFVAKSYRIVSNIVVFYKSGLNLVET